MHDSSLSYRAAADLAQLIRRREVSPVELTKATLDRIERSQPVLNAFITVCQPTSARAAARAADAAVMRATRRWDCCTASRSPPRIS